MKKKENQYNGHTRRVGGVLDVRVRTYPSKSEWACMAFPHREKFPNYYVSTGYGLETQLFQRIER